MPRTPADPTSVVQRRLALYSPIIRELDKLKSISPDAVARVLTWVAGLAEDGTSADAELRAMKSIAYRLDQADRADREHIARRLREDYDTSAATSASDSTRADHGAQGGTSRTT